jgi:hypothetical protein
MTAVSKARKQEGAAPVMTGGGEAAGDGEWRPDASDFAVVFRRCSGGALVVVWWCFGGVRKPSCGSASPAAQVPGGGSNAVSE